MCTYNIFKIKLILMFLLTLSKFLKKSKKSILFILIPTNIMYAKCMFFLFHAKTTERI